MSYRTRVGTPYAPSGINFAVAMNEVGLVLGLDTCLARMTRQSCLDISSNRERILTLCSVAGRRTVSPDILDHIAAAAGHWQRGDKALANLRLVFAGLPRLDRPVDAWRLRLAEMLLDKGWQPRDLMRELDLDPSILDLGKSGYNPNQPRVPAGNGPTSGRWEAIWNKIVSWLEEPVPEYDTDTGIQVGTRSRGRAIATNPLTVGVLGTAALFGGEAIAGAGALGGAVAAGPVTIADVLAALPEGMTAADFGRIAGFVQGLAASSQASIEPTAEMIAGLRAAGVTQKAISLARRFYELQANKNPANISAVQRAALLSNILKRYK